MTEPTFLINSSDREGTVASLVKFLEEQFQLPPSQTQPGVEMAFDAHNKVLEVLMDQADPEKIGLTASASVMFVFSQMQRSHFKTSSDIALSALSVASLHHRLEQMIGEK